MNTVAFNITTVEISQTSLRVLNGSQPFNYNFVPTIQLSQPSSEQPQYAGLLYTPSIDRRCSESTTDVISNVTLADLTQGYPFIALAPASTCRDTYVQQAIWDGARAIVLYPPTNGSFNAIPQVSISYNAQIPVYLADYMSAATIATQMSAYNNDVRTLEGSGDISNLLPTDSLVRLAMTVTRITPAQRLPALWIFLLVVLGLLCLIVASTSIAMVRSLVFSTNVKHLHQYLARRDLRRRIALGEVDLEGLGIKRLTVPKKYVDSMSQHIWKDNGSIEPAATGRQKGTDMTTTLFNQSNCSICLEDYLCDTTTVRELPCHHIFHPDCIDPFLLKRSSLCPLCKQSVLPKGYIPPDSQLTAATVMRERRRRRQARRSLRDHGSDIELRGNSSGTTAPTRVVDLQDNLAPDNEEEARELQERGRVRRLWQSLFPARNL